MAGSAPVERPPHQGGAAGYGGHSGIWRSTLFTAGKGCNCAARFPDSLHDDYARSARGNRCLDVKVCALGIYGIHATRVYSSSTQQELGETRSNLYPLHRFGASQIRRCRGREKGANMRCLNKRSPADLEARIAWPGAKEKAACDH